MLVLPFSDIAVEIEEDSTFATSDNLFIEEKIFIKRELSEIRLKTYILGRDVYKIQMSSSLPTTSHTMMNGGAIILIPEMYSTGWVAVSSLSA